MRLPKAQPTRNAPNVNRCIEKVQAAPKKNICRTNRRMRTAQATLAYSLLRATWYYIKASLGSPLSSFVWDPDGDEPKATFAAVPSYGKCRRFFTFARTSARMTPLCARVVVNGVVTATNLWYAYCGQPRPQEALCSNFFLCCRPPHRLWGEASGVTSLCAVPHTRYVDGSSTGFASRHRTPERTDARTTATPCGVAYCPPRHAIDA